MCREISKYGVVLIELMKHDFWVWFRGNAQRKEIFIKEINRLTLNDKIKSQNKRQN